MRSTLIFLFLAPLFLTNCRNNTVVENEKEETTMKADIFKSGYADVNGLKMYYEIHGQGQPIVLIHGGGSTIETSFGRIIPSLSKNRQVIVVELQAHGRTSDRESPESFEQDADDVAALLENLKIEKADFFGFSNGGNTAMQIAIRHPQMVRKIILGSSFYRRDGMDPKFWESMEHATLDDMPQGLKDAYKKVAPDTSGLIKMFEKDKARMVGFKDWKAEDLQSISAPALIIIGDQDIMRPEHAVEMYRLLPHARLAIIPGIHGAYMGEATTGMEKSKIPELTTEIIEEFLNEPETKVD